MRLPNRDAPRSAPDSIIASEDAARHAEEAVPQLEHAIGVDWYERPGTAADAASVTLCRLRRARAGERGGRRHGDDAVREVLRATSPEALAWIASRAISYMDESGFPEAVEPWLPAET